MRSGALAALTVATVFAGAACSSDSGAGDDGASGDTAPTAQDALTVAMQRAEGRYAHYDVVAYEGSGMKTLIISYGFTDLEVIDGELVSTESFCSSEHRSDQPISVDMSDAATQAIKPVPVATEVDIDPDGQLAFFRPATPTGIGIHLEDPANEPLPTDPTDPRIADDDDDGKPGVTVSISSEGGLDGELYIARREIFAYEVAEQPDGTFTGAVEDDSEQLVIGASDPIFMNEGQWVQVPDPTLSPILLVPVDSDWDCEMLMSNRDDLFPATPEVDW